jgi:hypothetical protein
MVTHQLLVCDDDVDILDKNLCENVYKSFRTGRLERELQLVQLSVTRCTVSLFCESV